MPTSPPVIHPRQLLKRYFDIREGEWRPTLLLAAQLMMGIAAVICLKATSDSLFLSEFSASRLPWVDLAVTGLVGLVVGVYLRLSNRLGQGRLVSLSQVFLAANLLLFWLLMRWELPGAPALVYIWVGVFAVLVPSQVWTLAGLVFDTRQAKRVFSLIGSGGLIGAALGGQIASIAGPRIGAESLLLAAMVLVLGCAAIPFCLDSSDLPARPGADPSKESKASLGESFRRVRESRYLTFITAAIFLSTLAGTLVKYQFKAVVKLQYLDNASGMVSFFGDFYGFIAVFSFLFHTLLSARLLRWIGPGSALLILPCSLLMGSGVLLFSASLWAVVLARGSDQAFRHSVDRASLELLYVPISAAVRARVKGFLDMVVSRSADAMASILLLAVFTVLGLESGQVSGPINWLTLSVIGIWVVIAMRLRREYVQTLRSSIERKEINPEALLRDLARSEAGSLLQGTLQSSDLKSVEHAVGWLRFGAAGVEHAQIAALLAHESGAIRVKAMQVVATRDLPGYRDEVLRFLALEPGVEARWQGLRYLEGEADPGQLGVIEELTKSDDRDLAAAASAFLLNRDPAKYSTSEAALLAFVDSARSGDIPARQTAARLIGCLPSSEATTLPLEGSLAGFLRDESFSVVEGALLSVATVKPKCEVTLIRGMLGDRNLRAAARKALAAYGESVLPQLRAELADASAEPAVRRQIPRVLADIGGQRAAELLLASLDEADHIVRHQILRALSRIGKHRSSDLFRRAGVGDLIVQELRRYFNEVILLRAVSDTSSRAGALFLRRALDERIRLRLDWIFRLLALIYPRREMLDAYHWIVSGRADLRSNAIEFLDRRLEPRLRLMVLSALEDRESERVFEAAGELFGIGRLAETAALENLLNASDPWLQSCACFKAAEAGRTRLRAAIATLAGSSDPLLAETASLASRRLAAGSNGS